VYLFAHRESSGSVIHAEWVRGGKEFVWKDFERGGIFVFVLTHTRTTRGWTRGSNEMKWKDSERRGETRNKKGIRKHTNTYPGQRVVHSYHLIQRNCWHDRNRDQNPVVRRTRCPIPRRRIPHSQSSHAMRSSFWFRFVASLFCVFVRRA
jgi:hypothetical protein